MATFTFTVIKWTFLVIGLAFLGAATQVPRDGAIVMLILGLAFGSIGGGILGHGWWRTRRDAELRAHGHRIEADFQQVELNTTLEVNGSNPFRIVAQWHDHSRNEVHIFKSDNLWFDPSDFVQGKKIPVFLDAGNPSKYLVDLSFLPRERNA